MLRTVKDDIRKNYYDPTFRGADLDALFAGAEIAAATSNGEIFGVIAQAVLDLDDSHTFFLPPVRANRTEYGFQMLAVGERILVSALKPRSDAEAKGLKVGDEVLAVNGYPPRRADLQKLAYVFYTLRPQPRIRLTVRTPRGEERNLDVTAKVKEGALVTDLTGEDIWHLVRAAQDEDRLNHHRYVEVGDEALIWKMPSFEVEEGSIDQMMGKARKRPQLILDLRGNAGGYVRPLEWLIGYLFDRDVKISDLKSRKETKAQTARRLGVKEYLGKLVVLVDSASASAAEVLARVVQLEKRGTVIGDRTAGAVMQSRVYEHELGFDSVVFYAVSVTHADVIMGDGKSLEGTGVTPDELVLPSPEDLAAGRDPVMSRALASLGITLPPEAAGALFPVEWASY
jgi:carboxyl-terminal processing protease